MAKQLIAQALSNVFGAATVHVASESNLIDVISQEDPWSDDQVAATKQIAAEYGWKVTVARRGRWVSVEGPIVRKVLTQDAIDAMSR